MGERGRGKKEKEGLAVIILGLWEECRELKKSIDFIADTGEVIGVIVAIDVEILFWSTAVRFMMECKKLS